MNELTFSSLYPVRAAALEKTDPQTGKAAKFLALLNPDFVRAKYRIVVLLAIDTEEGGMVELFDSCGGMMLGMVAIPMLADGANTTVIVGVAPDALEDIAKMIPKVEAETNGKFAITLLSDAEHQVIDRYGLLNERTVGRARQLPHPTTYVIDKTQSIRWKFTEVDFKIRPTNEMILTEISKLP